MKKKKALFMAAGLALLALPGFCAAQTTANTVSSGCNAAVIEQNANTVYQNTLTRADQQIAQPDALTGCIGSLSGFSLNIPGFDLSGLLGRLEKEACSIASNGISTIKNTAINDVNNQVGKTANQYLPPGTTSLAPTVGNGNGSAPVTVNTNNGGTNAVNNVTGSAVNQVQGKTNNTLGNILGGQ